MPNWLWNLVCKFPHKRWQELCSCEEIILANINRRLPAHRTDLGSDKDIQEPDTSARVPLLAKLLKHKIGGEDLHEENIISECMALTCVFLMFTEMSLTQN